MRLTRRVGLLGLVVAGFWARNYFEDKAAGLQKLALPNSGYVIPPAGDSIMHTKNGDMDVRYCQLELRSINIHDVFDAEFRKDNPRMSWWMDSLGEYALNYQHSFLVMRHVCRPLNSNAPFYVKYEMLNPIPTNNPDGTDILHFPASLVASLIGINYAEHDFGAIIIVKKELWPSELTGHYYQEMWVPGQMQDWIQKSHCIVLAQGSDAMMKWVNIEKAADVITAEKISYQVGRRDCNSAVNAMLLSAGIEPIETPGKLVTGFNTTIFDQITKNRQYARSN